MNNPLFINMDNPDKEFVGMIAIVSKVNMKDGKPGYPEKDEMEKAAKRMNYELTEERRQRIREMFEGIEI